MAQTTETQHTACGGAIIKPWKVVDIDREYGGCWLVAGDLTGDGVPELVSAQNYNENDVHYTSAVAAQRLDGSVLWRWGDPTVGRRKLHHDVACQIHDWDGNGCNDVIVAADEYLIELDGATGQEKRRIPIPAQASDCVVFADFSGVGRKTDVLVKTRYGQIWAYNQAGNLLWTVEMPGGYKTAHQPEPIDINGDGRDELMAGYAMLNPNGSVRWVFESQVTDLSRGHLDTMRVLRAGENPEDYRLVITCCGAENIAMLDGCGKAVWELPGKHFESLDIGHFIPGMPGLQIAVDIDHVPWGESYIWLLDEGGKQVGEFKTVYSRTHRAIKWDKSGLDRLAVGQPHAFYDAQGNVTAIFEMDGRDYSVQGSQGIKAIVGDMTGNGRPDLIIATDDTAFIYQNTEGPVVGGPVGTGLNFTWY